jgi:hypothetical protein
LIAINRFDKKSGPSDLPIRRPASFRYSGLAPQFPTQRLQVLLKLIQLLF